jgi:hypothetical protein
MDEGEILDMGRRLILEHQALEQRKHKWLQERLEIQKKLALIYTYGRELDLLAESDSTFPLVLKFMIERIRGLSSSLLWREPDEENIVEVDLYMNNAG